ncbi:unnamed protein product [Urochloa humidicola]
MAADGPQRTRRRRLLAAALAPDLLGPHLQLAPVAVHSQTRSRSAAGHLQIQTGWSRRPPRRPSPVDRHRAAAARLHASRPPVVKTSTAPRLQASRHRVVRLQRLKDGYCLIDLLCNLQSCTQSCVAVSVYCLLVLVLL